MERKLPKSWIQISVSEVGTSITGNTPSTKDPDNYGGSLPYIKPPKLNNRIVSSSEEYLSDKGAKLARILPLNSVLVSCIGNLGRTALNTVPVAFNQQINAIIPNDVILPKYLFFQAQSSAFRCQLEEKATATTISIVNKGNFDKILINLAPLNEQKRIVAKIEELFSELDNGIAALKTAREQLKVYRQAVLKHAFEGKLTAKWREENADKLETPEQLLARIQKERDARYKQQLEEWKVAVKEWEVMGKEGKKPGRPIKLTEIREIQESILSVLPNGWCWMHFGDIITIASNLVSPADFQDLPHIAPDNIERDTGKLLAYRTIAEDEVFSPKHYFFAGQIIYSKIRPNLSKLVLADFDGLCSADMYPLQSEYYAHSFLKYAMLTKNFVSQASTAGSRSVLPKINQAELSKLTIPFCCISEQIKLVELLETNLSVIESTRQEIERQLLKANILRQAILKKAFSGQLVSQDPSDESVNELLERIKATKSIKNTCF